MLIQHAFAQHKSILTNGILQPKTPIIETFRHVARLITAKIKRRKYPRSKGDFKNRGPKVKLRRKQKDSHKWWLDEPKPSSKFDHNKGTWVYTL